MNPYEQSMHMLSRCPIPPCIQEIIYYMLVGYGTGHANAIKTRSTNQEVPRKFIKFGTFYSSHTCHYVLQFIEKTVIHNYDNATYSSICALYENHLLYMIKRQELLQIKRVENMFHAFIKNKLLCFMVEEKYIPI